MKRDQHGGTMRWALVLCLCICGSFATLRGQGYRFETLAGRPLAWGVADGTGSAARFHTPAGITIAPDGRIFVTTTFSNTVREITDGGVVTTYAGDPTQFSGNADGPAAAATFAGPSGIAFDAAGNCYIADTYNSTIRKISAAKVVTTLAGMARETGTADGRGSEARFNRPIGIAVDRHGNVWVADTGNDAIRKIDPEGNVTTAAGLAGTRGDSDGIGAAARFNTPRGIAIASDDSLYIADSNNQLIRRMTPAAVVSTVAGVSGKYGSEDGPVASARFNVPYAVAVDTSGRVFVAEPYRVRVITPEGLVLSLAGSADHSAGSADGIGDAVRFYSLLGIAVSASGKIYVTDSENETVRVGSPTALAILTQPKSQVVRIGADVTFTVGASGTTEVSYQWRKDGTPIAGATGAVFTLPNVQLGASGRYDVVVTDPSASVTSVTADLLVSAPPANDAFANAIAISTAHYATSTDNNAASREAGEPSHGGQNGGASIWWKWVAPAEPSGAKGHLTVSTSARSISTLIAVYAGTDLAQLRGVASGQTLDGSDHAVVTFTVDPGSSYAICVDGVGGGMGDLEFRMDYEPPTSPSYTHGPADVTTVAGANVRFAVEASGGEPLSFQWRKNGQPIPWAVDRFYIVYNAGAADEATYDVVISNAVGRITTAGGALRLQRGYVFSVLAGQKSRFGGVDGSLAEATFNDSWGLALDAAGNLYVADAGPGTIRKITPEGTVSTLAGNYRFHDGADGVGAAAQFNQPTGLAMDRNGNLYVADTGNHTIRKVTPAGEVSTLAGAAGASGRTDGTGAAARFQEPRGLAVDRQGYIYVADAGNRTVRRITPGGVVTTIAGKAGVFARVDGPPAVSRFITPYCVALSPDESRLYVGDAYDHTIRLINLVDNTVSTYAGGNPGGAGGPFDGTRWSATFDATFGIAVDAAENVYVSSFQTVRKISTDGNVSKITNADFSLNYAYGIVVDPNGRLLVTDSRNYLIQTAVPDGSSQTNIPPRSQTVSIGSAVVFSAAIQGGTASSYQWQVSTDGGGSWTNVTDGGLYTGATQSSLKIGAATAALNGQRYRCIISTPAGLVTTASAVLSVAESAPASRLVNIAARAFGGEGGRVAVGGFVITGSSAKRVLLRAVGPSLTDRGISASETMLDPEIEVHDAVHQNRVIAVNDNWSDNSNAAEISSVAATVGAAALSGGDARSAAAILSLDPGVYTFIARGKSSTSGVVLVEVYDADAAGTNSRLVNISARAYCMAGVGVTIGGFVVTGNRPKQLLIRAVGPSLVTQGVEAAEVLQDPVIELHDAVHANAVIASNDDWSGAANAAEIVSAGARLGATPLASGDSQSSAMLLTVAPGVYTFVVSGKGGTSGVVLAEVYDAD